MVLPRSAWEQARERFVKDLEEPERLMFAEASLENIFYSASAAQKSHQNSSRSRNLASKLDVLLAGIDQYGKAMDVFSQASPFLCSLWGALRVVIHLSCQLQKYFAILIDMFEHIGDVLPRFETYEALFSSNPWLMQSLSNVYLNILEFCTSVKTAFKKERKSVMNAKVLFKLSWRSVEQQFETLMKDFQRHRKSVEKEAELAHLVEADKARAVMRAKQQQQEKQNSESERRRLLSMLSSNQWKQQHSRIFNLRYPGTGTWILTNRIFDQWKMATGTHQQRCLWCYGIPGSGKTILTASVINALSQEVDGRHSALAYFYCDYADQETLDASVIFGTIIQQLLIARPVMEDVIAAKIREAYGDGMRKPSSDDLIKILDCIILEYQCVYIVLDGVDEASPDTQERLFANFAKLSVIHPRLLRLFFSTRLITLMPYHFPSCLSFNISDNVVSEDIEHYIKASVQQRLHNLPVIDNYPYLEERAVLELTAKAQGLFLWVSLQLEELCDPSHSERSFTSALQDLPEGLTATYERVCNKINCRSTRQKFLAERIFDWTLCVRRPLKFDELKEAVAIELDDVSWDRRKISAETDEKRFLHVCGNLVVFHETDSTVRLAHHTVGKFLEQHKKDRSQTDAKIGHTCLTYLGFADFETQVISVGKKQDILEAQTSRQAGFYRIPKVLGIANGLYDFLLGLYSRNSDWSLPDVNYAELTRRHQKKALPESLSQKYRLLEYVTANWIWHAKAFDPKTLKWWSTFEKLVFYKALPFDFRPWNTLEGPSNLPHLAVYLWALENDHLPLLLLLRDLPGHCSLRPYLQFKTLRQDRIPPHMLESPAQKTAVTFHQNLDAYDWPVMKALLEGTAEMRDLCMREMSSTVSYQHLKSHALKDANLGLLESLLRFGEKVQKSEIDASNALHTASRRGDQDLVRILLDLGADANSRLFQDKRGRTPLCEAAMSETFGVDSYCGPYLNGTYLCSPLDTMLLLLDRGADPNAKQIGEATVLHKAIDLGEAYVRLLLSRGADVDARNDQHESILDLAVDASDRMIDILVEYGVSLEAKDPKGQTALLKAAEKKQDDTARVKTLIGHGADVHARDISGRTVLHLIRSSGEGTLQRVLELGADPNARDERGATPLNFAVRQNDNAKFKLLLEFGAVSGEGSAPLTEAAAYGNEELVDLLLRMGTDPNLLGDNEMSALSSATQRRYKEVVITLLGAGADPNLVDKSRVAPLSRAIMSKDKEIGRLLIEAGAVIQPPDPLPFSPIYLAIGSGDVDMLRFLIQQGAEVSSFRPSDWTGLRPRHAAMCTFLSRLGVPFTLFHDDDDDED